MLDISPEHKTKLKQYVALLLQWNQRINLIAKSTERDVWERHILDSAQLLKYIPDDSKSLVDLGSGAGFPGLVLAILGVKGVHLIESNNKKATFLKEAIRVIGCNAKVTCTRIEDIPPRPSDVITARALAPLDRLIKLAKPFMNKDSVCLFLKGKNLDNELNSIKQFWHVTERRYESILTPDNASDKGWVLELRDIQAKDD